MRTGRVGETAALAIMRRAFAEREASSPNRSRVKLVHVGVRGVSQTQVCEPAEVRTSLCGTGLPIFGVHMSGEVP